VPTGGGRDAGDHLPESGSVGEHDLVVDARQDERVQAGCVLAVIENSKPFYNVQ
jgi:hypothetical protein